MTTGWMSAGTRRRLHADRNPNRPIGPAHEFLGQPFVAVGFVRLNRDQWSCLFNVALKCARVTS